MVLSLSTILVGTMLPAEAWAVPGDGMSREQITLDLPDLPESERVDQDANGETNLTTAVEVPVDPYEPTATQPWAQDSGVVDLTGLAAGDTKPVDDLPVALGVPAGTDPAALAGTWSVDLAAPEASQVAGVQGLIMKITPPATADPAAEVALAVDYTPFADMYGPQAADRFGVMLLPDCVYDAPDSGDCATSGGTTTMSATTAAEAARVESDVELVPAEDAPTLTTAAEDETTRRVVTGSVPVSALVDEQAVAGSSARTSIAAESTSGSNVVGVLDTGASASGDFTATPLLSSGSWAAGSSSGAFTYSYQVQVPETAGGLMPKVALSYSSQSVDGRTSATNNQASWIGDGWDYSAGAITRSYANCRQDSKKPGSNNGTHRTADLCWGSNNATLSLGGMTTELVWNGTTWTTANGDGSKVQLEKDTSLNNGDADGEYWIVTTKDGTKYHFGRHRLPGWSDHGTAADDPVTNSVLTVPVYGNHLSDGDPAATCYKAGDWPGSACTQAWRWALDYVEDIHGNAMTFWWQRETNYYAQNFNFKAPVAYHRGGYLDRIDYGLRKDNIFTGTAAARVNFVVAERCFDEGTVTCSEANFTSTDPSRFRIWYDTPADLRCAAGQKCWNAGPSFFTRKRLDKISTSALRRTDTSARQVVDEYQLKQSFPTLRTGPNTALWLESITRTGYARNGTTDAKVTLNPVRFEANAEDMPNRVKRDNRPGFSRLRIARVINEYGGETVVTYKAPAGDCATGTGLPGKTDTAALKANNRLCYPSFWHPDAAVEEIDWFHKYVVDTIEELPNVDGAFSTTTRYAYENPGWRLAEQEFTKKSTRTYSQFAGFEQTTVYTGADDPDIGSKRTKSVTRYFRGMGDTVSVLDSADVEIAKDLEPFAGRVAEELTYANADDADADWLTRSVTYPEARELARRNRDDGLSPLQAWRVTEPRQVVYTRSSGTGDDDRTQRTVETRTTFETAHGLPTHIEVLGDTGMTGDESCTFAEYHHQLDKNIIGLTKQIRTSPTSCADATFDNLTTLSAANRVAYDGTAYGTALGGATRGLATETWSLKGDGSGFQTGGTTGFDAIGRVTTKTDPDGKISKITYGAASNGQTFTVTEENSLGHRQVTELEPGRAVSLKTTDLNNRVSEAKYDPLGRLVEAWGAGRTPSTSAVPDFRAEYATPAGKPPYITTFARGHENRIQTSVTLYDGLGRERQTQEEATGGGRLITDTLYNSSGEVWQTNNAYFAEGSPIGQLFKPLADTAVPNATRYTYDGLGRVTQEMPVLRGVDTPSRGTSYSYGADHSTVVNPTGAASYRIFTDALGRTARVDTFTNVARTTFTSMRYQYDTRGQLAKATHSADPTRPWTWTYDQRGRMETATDPDSGTTRVTYDHRDRQLTSTNARNVTVWNGYDELSRPTQQRLGGSTGALLSEFTYDTVAGGKGLPATATRYTDGLPYTQSIGGYTNDYQPTSTTLTLPQSIADTWGLRTSYTYDYTYTDTGLPESTNLPAVGGLPAEKLLVRYTKDGLPLSVSGKDWYGAETAYSPYGQVLRSTLGAQPYRVWTMSNYDDASGALTDQQVYREQTTDKTHVAGNLVSHRSYWYDGAGNVTSIRERSLGIEERQCFTYDPIGQLRKAWTAKDQNSCLAGPISGDGTVNAGAGTDGSGYWQEYEYDLLGNRSKLVEKNLAGDTTKDATTTYSYGKADGSQPRTLTKVAKKYVTPAGAAVTAEAERLYELTGETKSVTSIENGDQQTLSWTYDGQVERIVGEGGKGKTAYVGLANKCIDLSQGLAQAGQPTQLYPCNGTVAQKWAFAPEPNQANANLGAISVYDTWCLQPAANTAGSVLQIQKCDGSANQRLERLSTGQLKHTASGLCVAVKDANSANSTPIVLATCSASVPAQLWEAQNETRHIYGPGGIRLLTIQDRQATLNLGESQVTVQQGGALVNTQRTYAAPGGAVLRYAYGNGTSGLVALAGDHQGSPYAEVVLGGSMSTRIRKQDPFGNQRGAARLGVNMQTHAGFLGAARDDASGYTPLGARLYDPAVGRFLSADPILDLADPLQSNGYAYAHNNPVTHSDPTGLSVSLTASEMAAALAGAGLSAAQVAQAQSDMGKSLTSVILESAWYILKEFIGINDAMNCFGGDMWACGSLIIGAIPWAKLGKIPAVIRAVDRTIAAIQAWQAAKKAAEAVLAAAKAAEMAALNAKKLAIERAKKAAAQAAKKKAADKINTTSNKATNAAKKTGNPAQKNAQAKSNPKGSSAGSAGSGKRSSGGGKSGARPGGTSGASARSNGGSSGGSCKDPGNSFVPGTRVLMADGSTKSIENVKPGDRVMVTDPKTGQTEVETVTAAIKGDGVKRLVKITIDTDGERGAATAEVIATDGHPFWVPEMGEWVDAADLRPGQWVLTSTAALVQILRTDHWAAPQATVHNLTVANIHTYYVVAADTSVLVHNCGDNEPPFENQMSNLDGELAMADSLGVRPVSPGEAGFDAAIDSGTVKWAITEDGAIKVMPKTVNGVEIPHTALTRGGRVLSAGEADIAGGGGVYFGLSISNHSGHYQPCNCSLDAAVKVFGGAGITFAPGSVEYRGRR